MMEIELTRGKVALVDDTDYDRISIFNWYARECKRNGMWYAVRDERRAGSRRLVYMHRYILGLTGQIEVDHKDRDGLNNRRANMRVCTRTPNVQNRGRFKNKRQSRYKGVYRNKFGIWWARITVNKKRIRLGTFDMEIEAAKSYNDAAREHFGDFAYQNSIPAGVVASKRGYFWQNKNKGTTVLTRR